MVETVLLAMMMKMLFVHTHNAPKTFPPNLLPQKNYLHNSTKGFFYAKPLACKKTVLHTSLLPQDMLYTEKQNIQTFDEILTHRAVLYIKVMKVTLYIFLRASAFTHKTFLHRRFCSGAFTCKCLCTPMLLHKKM